MNQIITIDGSMLEKAFKLAAQNINANKEYVNELNVFPVPDGDTGTNMSMTLSSAVASIEPKGDVSEVMKQISRGALMGARGNSGVILSQILKGMSIGLEACEEASIEDLNNAFIESKNSAYKAVMKPTEGTILTVVRGISEFSQENRFLYKDIVSYLEAVIEHGNQVLSKTPDMLKELRDAGVVDAGGKGYILILEGILQGLVSDEFEYSVSIDNFDFFANKQNHNPDEIEYSYCTEFMINGPMDKAEDFREDIARLGDSVIVVNDDDLTKVHLHTNNPGQVIENALKFGYLSDIKIDNMKIQTSNRSSSIKSSKDLNKEEKDYGFVVVSSGAGISEIFNSLGIDRIIEGGQTMNPSTEDILEAVEAINARDIFIFPNNKNIIMSANQVVELSDKNIHVIPTKQIPEAITGLLSFSQDLGVSENLRAFNEALTEVKTIQITYAIRDSKVNGIEIREDDYIGLVEGEILGASKDIYSLSIDMVDKIIDEDSYLITIYSGEESRKEDTDRIFDEIQTRYTDIDIDLIEGGQPVYNYLISIE